MRNISSLPLSRDDVGPRRTAEIRHAVQQATSISTDNYMSRLASIDDADMFLDFLRDPAVSAPIYTLPTTLNRSTVQIFIEDHLKEQSLGQGLLFFNFDETGQFGGYTDLQIWPQWAAGELGGAVHPHRQGRRNGIEGARLGFQWMFDVLGLDVICETAALDNTRTARLLDRLGFRRVGQTISTREDGTKRPSLVWEITQAEWLRIHA